MTGKTHDRTRGSTNESRGWRRWGPSPARISIVIPVLNDAAALDALLDQVRRLSSSVEIIVADGGKDGGARDVCRRHDATWIPSPEGRGVQMNRGAAAGRGDVLWFLHADATVHPDSLDAIGRALADPEVVGGAFRFRLHQRVAYAAALDFGVGFRCRWLKLPYGDQGIFVRRSVFEAMAGYRQIVFLEDVDFIRRLRRFGRLAMLRTPIGVSSRRWEREGFLYSTLRNWLVTASFLLGVRPERLIGWYRPDMTASSIERAPKPRGELDERAIARIE